MKSILGIIIFVSSGISYASINSVHCKGIVYNEKTEISNVQPEIFKTYGLEADLYVTIANPPFKTSVYMDLQKIAEVETPSTLELTYLWCPKHTPINPSCSKAIRVLKIDKQTGAAQFFNKLEDKSNYLVSTSLSCQVQ